MNNTFLSALTAIESNNIRDKQVQYSLSFGVSLPHKFLFIYLLSIFILALMNLSSYTGSK